MSLRPAANFEQSPKLEQIFDHIDDSQVEHAALRAKSTMVRHPAATKQTDKPRQLGLGSDSPMDLPIQQIPTQWRRKTG